MQRLQVKLCGTWRVNSDPKTFVVRYCFLPTVTHFAGKAPAKCAPRIIIAIRNQFQGILVASVTDSPAKINRFFILPPSRQGHILLLSSNPLKVSFWIPQTSLAQSSGQAASFP